MLKNLVVQWNELNSNQLGFSEFCRSIFENSSIESIDLRNNKLGSRSAIEISEFIKRNHTLKTLDLRWNDLLSEGGKYLLEGMAYNSTINELLISGNKKIGRASCRERV